MVKATTPKNKKTSKRPQSIIKIVLIAILVIIAGLFIYNQTQLNNEKNAFMQLRADFKSLQTEFNKIDAGWEYKESCTGKGGVYNDDEASNCILQITNNSRDFVLSLQEKVADYSKTINNSRYLATTTQKSYIEDKKKYEEISINTERFNVSNCSLYNNYPSSDKAELKLVCIIDAKQFYFQRSD